MPTKETIIGHRYEEVNNSDQLINRHGARPRVIIPVCTRHQRSSLASPTTQTTPSIYVINAAALSKPHAIEQLTVDLNNYNIDLAAVTETHFKAKHCDSIVAIPDHTLLRRDRTRRRGGGVAVYARTSLKAEIWQYSGDNNVFELLWITTGDLFVGVVYHPPKPCYDVDSFLDYLEATVNEISFKFPTSEIVMVGDFNQLSGTVVTQRTGLTHIVNQPTRGSNTLDRIFESSPIYTGVKVVTSTLKSDAV